MVAFVTLCEAYMGIEPHSNLWNYFFRARLQSSSDTEAVVLGGVDIYVRSGPRVDPYFCLLMSDPPTRWQKVWFFFRNGANAPLPCSRVAAPSFNLNGGMGWPRKTFIGYDPYVMSSSSYYEVG
jgi:hypothetical protein